MPGALYVALSSSEVPTETCVHDAGGHWVYSSQLGEDLHAGQVRILDISISLYAKKVEHINCAARARNETLTKRLKCATRGSQ